MLYLTEKDQQQLLNMREVIDEVAESLKAFSEGETETPLRYSIPFNEDNRYLVMPALSDALKIVGLKTVTFAPKNPEKGKSTISGSVILSDYETGETLSVLDGGYLTKIRTGAISGVATKYLSRVNSSTLCVIGAGEQAEGLIAAVLAVRDINTIHFTSRTIEKAERLAKQTKDLYDVNVEVIEYANQAIEGTDIVVTATNSSTPVFDRTLDPGVHLNAVGSFKADMQELPTESMIVANKIVVESTEAAMEETGDLKIPEQEGVFTQDMLYAELGHIVAGRKQGRTDEKEVTLFKSVGLAIVDIVVANYFYKKAQK